MPLSWRWSFTGARSFDNSSKEFDQEMSFNGAESSEAWPGRQWEKFEREVDLAPNLWALRAIHQVLAPILPPCSERDRTEGLKQAIKNRKLQYLTAMVEKEHDMKHLLRQHHLRAADESTAITLARLASTLSVMDMDSLDQKILGIQSLPLQIEGLSEALQSRTRLCRLCLEVSEQIAAFPYGKYRTASPFDAFWPRSVDDIRTSITGDIADGIRMVPPEKIDGGKPLPPTVIKHLSGRALAQSARTCPFCELLRVALILDCNRLKRYPLDRTSAALVSIVLAMRMGTADGDVQRILEGVRMSDDPVYLVFETPDALNSLGDNDFVVGHLRVVWQKPVSLSRTKDDRSAVFTKLRIFSDSGKTTASQYHLTGHSPKPDSPLRPWISPRQPLRSSSSEKALLQIKQWYNHCNEHHEWCRHTISGHMIPKGEAALLPTRLLDLGSSDADATPRLVITSSGAKGHWAALSHCWGSPENHPLKTTRSTLAEHMRNISMASLPQTFQDAIVVTRKLGLRYLWIDSLCIVQYDEQDWQNESQAMGRIYEHAAITLAASSATDSSQGLFRERPYGELKFPGIQLPFIVRDETSRRRKTFGNYSISVDWRQEPFMQHLDPYSSRLYTRGWCTQEMILSKRVVHFLEEGLVWVCKERAEDETGTMLVHSKQLIEANWDWGRLVQEHSTRLCTFERDRLVSLDCLAREVCKKKDNCYEPDMYHFGTWIADMPEHLLWASYRIDARRNEQCPSWSWASNGGAVWFRFRDWDNFSPHHSLTSHCRVVGVDGECGVLKIEAKIFDISNLSLSLMEKVSLEQLEGGKGLVAFRAPLVQGYRIGVTSDSPQGWIEFDDNRDVLARNRPLYFLHLMEAEYSSEIQVQHWGILLEEDERRRGVFGRVGLGTLWNLHDLERTQKQEVAIA
jgi:hypothetical protein